MPYNRDGTYYSDPSWTNEPGTPPLVGNSYSAVPGYQQLQQFIGSPQGQALPAGQFNAARDQYQNAWNSRPGTAPVAAAPSIDLRSLVRQFGQPTQQPSWGVAGDNLYMNGKVTPGLSAMAQDARMEPVKYAEQMAAANTVTRPEDERRASFRKYAMQRGLDALQINDAEKHIFGSDSDTWMEHALKMQGLRANLEKDTLGTQKAYIDQASGIGKMYKMDAPDMLASAGMHYIDPATGQGVPAGDPRGKNVYSVFRTAHLERDPITGEVIEKVPSGYVEAQPAHIRQLQQIMKLSGYDNSTPAMGGATSHGDALARISELQAKDAATAPVGAGGGASIPAGVALHRAAERLGGRVIQTAASAPGWMMNARGNVGQSIYNAAADAGNFGAQLFTGSPESPIPRMQSQQVEAPEYVAILNRLKAIQEAGGRFFGGQ